MKVFWKCFILDWITLLKRTLKTLIINDLILGPLLMIIEILSNGLRMRFSVDDIPSTLEMLLHSILILLIEDFMFYWVMLLF